MAKQKLSQFAELKNDLQKYNQEYKKRNFSQDKYGEWYIYLGGKQEKYCGENLPDREGMLVTCTQFELTDDDLKFLFKMRRKYGFRFTIDHGIINGDEDCIDVIFHPKENDD